MDDESLYFWRFNQVLCLSADCLLQDAELGVANDCDPEEVTREEWEKSKVTPELRAACTNRPKLTEASFPRIQWRPFAPLSRPRAWSRDDLKAALDRGLPYH